MKVNTKETILLSPSIHLRPNRSILDRDLSSDIQKKDNREMGRQLNYEPTMIVTPVLTSGRTERYSQNRPRINKSTVDEVCTMLNMLFIKDDTKENVTAEVKQTVEKQGTAEKVVEALNENKLGRLRISILNPKTESPVSVHRSARLATLYKD